MNNIDTMLKARAALARMKVYGDTFGYRSNEQNPYEEVCEAIAAIDALAEQPAPVQGWTPSMPITEEMHRAACKVLMRANGLDGTPRRMINAMLAAAPQPAQQEPLTDEEIGQDPIFRAGVRFAEAARGIKEST